jgi:hypothetical protein
MCHFNKVLNVHHAIVTDCHCDLHDLKLLYALCNGKLPGLTW